MFFDHDAIASGIVAIGLIFIVTSMTQGFKRRPFAIKKLWLIVIPCFVVFFAVTLFFSGSLGAPETGDLPVFALREHYLFTKGTEVSRLRFITVASSFLICWHGFMMAFVIDQWMHFKNSGKHLQK
ncbi:MAG: hypothetical protein JW774_06435 [Candidatus Aureabacteria bacterium]|nr:hypothetical protein [Candidatus Auribacterota bacterium]